MGALFSKFYSSRTEMRQLCIIMLGLQGAGKTTILCKMRMDQTVPKILNDDLNVELIKYKNIRFAIWDIGVRDMWYYCSNRAAAIIFVIDSSNRLLLKEIKEELHGLLSNGNLRNVVVLIFANKQDLPDALDITELTKCLELDQLKNMWCILPTCGISGNGLNEGLEHLYKMLKTRKRRALK